MTRLRPGRRPFSSDSTLATLLLGASLVVAVVLVVWFVSVRSAHVELDDSFCPRDTPPASYDIVVLDLTDAMNVVQKTAIRRETERIKHAVPVRGRLALYLVRRRLEERLVPDLALCNPGTGAGLSHVTANPRMVRRRWETHFAARIDSVLAGNLDSAPTGHSPIMEAIQAMALTAVPPEPGAPVRIHVFSDLLQHMPGYSQYDSGSLDFAAFARRPYFTHVRTDIQGAAVTIYYVRRAEASHIQGRRHVEFWERYFHALGGSVERVRQIEG